MARCSNGVMNHSEAACDLCGATSMELVGSRDRHGEPLGTGMCTQCGLVRHWQLPTEQELAAFYATQYRQCYHGESTPSPKRVWRAWRVGASLLHRLRAQLPPKARVFDIGAGIGCTVKQFELAGYTASGIEPGEGFSQFSRESLRADVRRMDLFDVVSEPIYDQVLLVHVIEHFRSPYRALTHIRSLLRPEGRVYVECPNLYAPFAVRSRLFHFAHIHNFTPFTLRMMAERCGFLVERTFGDERHPNLQFQLRLAAARTTRIDPESAGRTRECLARYNAVSYHLRPRYLLDRARKLAGYASEQLFARGAVQRIIRRCQETKPAGEPVAEPRRRAA